MDAGCFIQSHKYAYQILFDSIARENFLRDYDRMLDLFCGIGNFTVLCSRIVDHVHGIDSSEIALDAAKRSIDLNKIPNVELSLRDLKKGIPGNVRNTKWDVVLLDPPRTGAMQVISDLEIMQPDRIIYVSCDPSTLMRDLSPLLQHGYRLHKSVLVDLFPQTFHIESVNFLSR